MFFDGWLGLVRIVAVSVLAYCGLVLFLRVSGKRTLSKMNAFDLVITVALGSTLSSVVISRDVPLAEGLLAFGMLILLQYVITWCSVRSHVVTRIVKSEPSVLFQNGRFLPQAMKRERVNEQELMAAARATGVGSLDQIDAVVLETNGSFSILRKVVPGPSSTLHGTRPAADQ